MATSNGNTPHGPSTTPSRSFENILGTNVLGVVAAFLIILGLLFLGFLVIPNLNDAIKAGVMSFFGLALTFAGAFLTYRKKNAFTIALLSCGCGSVYISIMLTHAFFQLIPDLVAYGLLLLWLMGSLALVKLSDSRVMSIVVHAGMIVSLCFGYLFGLSPDRVVVLLAYHVLTVALIIVGNKLCCQKSYRLGLFCSLALSLVAVWTLFMYALRNPYLGNPALDMSFYLAILIHVIGASLISFALYRHSATQKHSAKRTVLHVINKTLLTFVYLVALYFMAGFFADEHLPLGAMDNLPEPTLVFATVIVVFALLAHVLVDVVIQRKKIEQRPTDTQLETISVLIMSLTAAIVMIANYLVNSYFAPSPFFPPALIVLAFVLMLCARSASKRIYSSLAIGLLTADFLFMIANGYEVLVARGTIIAGLIYLISFCSLMVFEWRSRSKLQRAATITPLKIMLILVAEVSVLAIFFAARLGVVATLLALSIIFVVALVFKLDTRNDAPSSLWVFFRISEGILILFNIVGIAYFAPYNYYPILSVLLVVSTLFILAMMLVRAKTETRFSASWLSVMIGICFSLTILATLNGMTLWSNIPFTASIALMLTALISVMTGFVMRLKPLRLYGLILVIVCVAKLVTIDIIDIEATMRVIAFITGGLICFGISALYNYSVKRFDEPHQQLDGADQKEPYYTNPDQR